MIPVALFAAFGQIVLNSQMFEQAERMVMAKKVTVYSQPG
jgi:hypothetical protein